MGPLAGACQFASLVPRSIGRPHNVHNIPPGEVLAPLAIGGGAVLGLRMLSAITAPVRREVLAVTGGHERHRMAPLA